MKTNKVLLFVIALLASQSLWAIKGDDVWNEVKDWREYCSREDVGDIEGMVLYDVDGDGINECVIIGEDGDALLTCGDGKGGYGMENIHLVVTSWNNTRIAIMKNQPYVTHSGGCGTGCYMEEFYKLEKSRMVSGYQNVQTVNPENVDEVSNECILMKPGQEPRKISLVNFNNNRPKSIEATDVEELDLIPFSRAAVDKPSVGESATLHYQSNDTIIIRDSKGYFYSILSNGELAVAPGGAYAGDIVIPGVVNYEDKDYTVTTVRREAFYKRPEAKNIGTITSITLPNSVTLIGADAFRNNAQLSALNYNKKARIEVRSFWGCPNLKMEMLEPVYAYTGSFDFESDSKAKMLDKMSVYYYPSDQKNDTVAGYQWVFNKYNHSGISFDKWTNMNKEMANAAYCSNPNYMRGGVFQLLNKNNAESMFKGSMNSGIPVVMADNSYVGTHEFPMYSRFMWGEEEKSAPEAFKQAMAKKYGKKVKYSKEVGKLLYTTNEQLIITEFAVTNGVAQYILSWLKDGKEVCTFSETTNIESEFEDCDVWNVDDDGDYGIPIILTIARNEKGNIELFLYHGAPESLTFSHLVQKGNKFEQVGGDGWYNWVDAPDD